MNSFLKKAAVLMSVFVAAVGIYFFSGMKNIEQAETVYTIVGEPTLPVVYVETLGREMNTMRGYLQDMGNSTARESLTILPENRELSVHISGYSGSVLGIRYEVRSLDMERLVERTKVENWTQEGTDTYAVLPIQNLLIKGREYLLQVSVDTESHGTIYYYTRIQWDDGQLAQAMVDLALDFSDRTFDYDRARELVTYLETNDTADNSSFGNVTIHSSFSQLTWGSMDVRREGDVSVTLKELDGTMGSVQIQYLAARDKEDGETELFEVEENFTMKWGELRIYMMDYNRSMNQIFEGRDGDYSGKRIMLGISDEQGISASASENGKVRTYIVNRDLWSYDEAGREALRVFSFRNEDGDIRSGYREHDIQVLKVNNEGDIDFVVYGYMNRGVHEGRMGIANYHYDASENVLDERFFIPVSKSFEEIARDVETLAYQNDAGMFYIYVDQAVYGIDLNSNELMMVASGLSEGSYAVSAGGSRFAWQEGKLYESNVIHLMDLESGQKQELQGRQEEYLRTLGFIGRDLVYGVAGRDDLWVINGRTRELPMTRIEIINEQMQVETRYERSGAYIADVSVEGSRVHLNRLSRLGEHQYQLQQEDTIVCNVETGKEPLDGIGWYASADQGKLYFVQLASDVGNNRSIRVSTPKQVGYDKSEELLPGRTSQASDYSFRAYAGGHLLGAGTDFTEVLNLAYDKMGIVVNEDQEIIWSRVNRSEQALIREPVSMSAIMRSHLESFSSSRMYSDGMLVLDARGCLLSQVLYFIDRGMPVMATLADGEQVLLCGYDQYNVTVCNPGTGVTEKWGFNDASEVFRRQGNDFICAILPEE